MSGGARATRYEEWVRTQPVGNVAARLARRRSQVRNLTRRRNQLINDVLALRKQRDALQAEVDELRNLSPVDTGATM